VLYNDFATFTLSQGIKFLLIAFRVGGIMIFAPFYGSANIPAKVKILWSMLMGAVLFPFVPGFGPERVPVELDAFLKAAFSELAVGVIIGLFATLVFVALQVAGQMMGQQMGIALANVLNPVFGSQISIIGNFYFFFGLVIFLCIDGHHQLLAAVVRSFEIVPLAGLTLRPETVWQFLDSVGGIFIVAIRVAAPVVIAMFLVTIALGFVARTVPQMNVLVVGFMLRIILGVLVWALAIGPAGHFIEDLVGRMVRELAKLIPTFAPP